MQKVDGIGGLFFMARDPKALAAWYRDHIGIDLVPGDYETPQWRRPRARRSSRRWEP